MDTTWGQVMTTGPLTVRIAGDTVNTPIAIANALTYRVGDKVALIRIGQRWWCAGIITGLPASDAFVVGVHTLTTAFVTVATHTNAQDEGLTITADEVADCRLRFTLAVNPYASGGVQDIVYTLLRNGVVIRSWTIPGLSLSASNAHSLTLTHIIDPTVDEAAVIYKVQLKAVASNTAVNSYGDATYQRQLLVENLGRA